MNIELLKNRSQPPGGWSYWCPVGERDFPGGFAFDVQVSKIREYRASDPSLNLPSDLGSVRKELLQFTFARLRKRFGAEEALKWFSITDTDDAEVAELIKKKQSNSPSSEPEPAAKPAATSLVATVGQLADGARVLKDWIGAGGVPVSPQRAGKRAGICRKCPLNVSGNWLQRLASGVAGFVKEQMALKNQMNLKVAKEEELGICQACSCTLALKVWCPISTIVMDTSELQRNGLHKDCWILKETGQTK